MPTCAFVSFRLGLTDGVSIVARNWGLAVRRLGFDVVTVAGEGPVDRTVAGLALDATDPPTAAEVEAALADADLVVVENLCTIPLNPAAARVVAEVLAGRPAVLHHHDPPWQRERFAHVTDLPPDDPAWRHVTVNRLTVAEMAERGITATCIYNGFETHAPAGDRTGTRAELGFGPDETVLAHPVRAIPRKDVPRAVAMAEELGGVYWLWGPAEDGYEVELERILGRARCRVARRTGGHRAADLYAACDAVLFPSTWEGFGNPPVEAAIHRRPVAVGPYPVADELRALGFGWYPTDDVGPLRHALAHPDPARLDHDRAVAERHLSLEAMGEAIGSLLTDAGWLR